MTATPVYTHWGREKRTLRICLASLKLRGLPTIRLLPTYTSVSAPITTPFLTREAVSMALRRAFSRTSAEHVVLILLISWTRLGLTVNRRPKNLSSFLRCGDCEARMSCFIAKSQSHKVTKSQSHKVTKSQSHQPKLLRVTW